MGSGLSIDDPRVAKLKEEYTSIIGEASSQSITLSDVLEMPYVRKFKEMLDEAGLLKSLKEPGKRMLIAPINDAFDDLDPVLSDALNRNRSRAITTIAQSHIITAPALVQAKEWSIETVHDMNGDEVDLKIGIVFHDRDERVRFFYVLHGINSVTPLEPRKNGSLKTSNGNIFFVPEIIVGKTILEAKYLTNCKAVLDDINHTPNHSLWELLDIFKLTKFAGAVERTGMQDLLIAPAEDARRLSVYAPIDEAFDDKLLYATEPANSETVSRFTLDRFVKRHLVRADGYSLLGPKHEPIPAELLRLPYSKIEASNGNLFLSRRAYMYEKPMGWEFRFFPLPRL